MRWRRLGKIFDPADYRLPNGCTAFAQSPQALVFEDFVRVYFSTRVVDTSGKFLSHVAFIDLHKNLRDIIGVSAQTALPLGALGCFDEHGIFPMSVLRVGDQIWGYTTGWNRRVSVSVDTAIGLVVSRDGGLTFERIGDGPVLGPSLREPCLVGDAFVRQIGGRFHMWYIFGTGWRREAPDLLAERTYKIGHAVSPDGVEWQKDEARQIIVDRLGPDESQALPTVISIGERWHMFFCYRHSFDFRRNAARGYRIGHAWSDDLIQWTRDDDDPSLPLVPDAWDSDMQCYPSVFECDGRVYMLYNGNEFGRHGFGLAVLET
jgi:hypothetical protein